MKKKAFLFIIDECKITYLLRIKKEWQTEQKMMFFVTGAVFNMLSNVLNGTSSASRVIELVILDMASENV